MAIYINPDDINWKEVQEMHENAQLWLNELRFIAYEHHFMEELLSGFFLKLSSKEHFSDASQLVKNLSDNKYANTSIFEKVQSHNNELYILMDDKHQPYEEKEIKAQHKSLKEEIEKHFHSFKETKSRLFDIVSKIMKEAKQKFLLE